MKTLPWAMMMCGTAMLSACGGGVLPLGGGLFVPTPTYPTLTNTTETTPSSIAGGAINSNTLGSDFIDGTFTHTTSSIFISNPSTPGFSSNATVNNARFNTYDYAQGVDIDVAGVNHTGIMGIETSASDVAGATNATYTVEFEGDYVSGASNETLANWTGTLTAGFAAGDVDMSVTGTGSASFDQITVTDATISGANISGGTLATLSGGTNVNLVATTTGLAGAFFGYDGAIGAPDEVGGVIVSQTGGNFLTGAFIGD